jgi:hypothetical protein
LVHERANVAFSRVWVGLHATGPKLFHQIKRTIFYPPSFTKIISPPNFHRDQTPKSTDATGVHNAAIKNVVNPQTYHQFHSPLRTVEVLSKDGKRCWVKDENQTGVIVEIAFSW